MQLVDLLKPGDESKTIVAAFPLEDTTKTLADIFPPSWINKDELAVIPLLLVPNHLVKDICTHMQQAGDEFLQRWFADNQETGTAFTEDAD